MDNKEIKSNAVESCMGECNKKLRECLRKGNDETFCRIKTVPCFIKCK